MRSTATTIACTLVIFFAGCLPHGAGRNEAAQLRLDAEVQRFLSTHDLPGLSVAVLTGGEPLYVRGFGWADTNRRVPVTEETLAAGATSVSTVSTTGGRCAIRAATGSYRRARRSGAT